MADQQKTHELAQQKAAKLLMKRTASVSTAFSDHHQRRKNYAGSVSTVSYMENLQEENSNPGGIKYENTYKLEPTKGGFPVKLLNIMLEEVLTDFLEDQIYEQDNCPRFTKSISEIIKTKAKDIIDPRYKVICVTHIGQQSGQGIRIGSRCLWNTKHDNCASVVYKNSSLFAISSIYGIYYD